MEDIFIIAGLGNPGSRYDNTRHNIGFDTVSYLKNEFNFESPKTKFKGIISEGRIYDKKVILVWPQTYMNLSGECVLEVVNWYKADLKNFIVVYDDIDIDLGKIRIKPKGSAGTHNGMKSVIYMLNNDCFPRVRIGLGKPVHAGYNLADFVLSKIMEDERKILDKAVKTAGCAISEIIGNGIDKAMNMYNK